MRLIMLTGTMKVYELNTPLDFGKYEGKTLETVFETDPGYIGTCLETEDGFTIDESAIQRLFEKYPEHELSTKAIDANLDKLDGMDMENDDDFEFEDEAFDDDDLEELDPKGKKGKDDDDWGDDLEEENDNWDDDDIDDDDVIDDDDDDSDED